MTENNDERQPSDAPRTITFTDEEVSSAQMAEQAALQEVTNQHLQNRVVTLRAMVNKLQAENADLRLMVEAHELALEEPVNAESASQ